MFGYVNVNKESLDKNNIEIYQSFYCGLCAKLKEISGPKGQMLLNYDMTFLIILLSGLYELEDEEKDFICKLHPTQKRKMRINRATEYAAQMNVLLSYQNFADDWHDDGQIKKRALMKLFEKQYKKIAIMYPSQAAAIEKCMRDLKKAEENGEYNVDIVAGYTGEMLSEIFAWEGGMWSENLKTLGFYLGKFIYIMDAYEDIGEDMKNGSYNVLYEIRRKNKKDFDTISKVMLVSMMTECAKAFERMPIVLYGDIIRNILYSGVWNKFEYLQIKKAKKEKK
ncbi:MAG: DUF5685 family protein [Eubacterium sp.]|nr:DUF5685 family protein [Eubacterium sp.]